MLDLLNKTEAETKIDTAAKRVRIESELQKGAGRSDREIARIVGCDHKTVGSARDRLGIASPLGNSPPSPTERRHMLIAGAEDLNKLYPPGPAEATTAEEQVDDAISKGVVNQAVVDAAVDQCRGHIDRIREERQAKAAEQDEANGEQTMVRPQSEITIQFRDDVGEWVIKQKNWPDDDGVIWINEEHMQVFLDALCDRLGIASVRGPVR